MDFFASRRSRKETVAAEQKSHPEKTTASSNASNNRSWLLHMSPLMRHKQKVDLQQQATSTYTDPVMLDALAPPLESETDETNHSQEQPDQVKSINKHETADDAPSVPHKSTRKSSTKNKKSKHQSSTQTRGRTRSKNLNNNKRGGNFFSRSLSRGPRRSRSQSIHSSSARRTQQEDVSEQTQQQQHKQHHHPRRIRSLSRQRYTKKSTTTASNNRKSKSKTKDSANKTAAAEEPTNIDLKEETAKKNSTTTKNHNKNQDTKKKKKKLTKKHPKTESNDTPTRNAVSPDRVPNDTTKKEEDRPEESVTHTTAQDLTESSLALEELTIEEVPSGETFSKSSPEIPLADTTVPTMNTRPPSTFGSRRHSMDNAPRNPLNLPKNTSSSSSHRRGSLTSGMEYSASASSPSIPLPPPRGRRSSMSAITRSDLEISPMVTIPASTGQQLRRSSLSNLSIPRRRGSLLLAAPPLYNNLQQDDNDDENNPQDQHSHLHDSNSSMSLNSSIHSSSRPILEVAPGVFLPLRGADETRQAVKEDKFISHKCTECHRELFCIADAAQILCPACQYVQPLWGSDALENEGGVGLGFTVDDLESMQWESTSDLLQGDDEELDEEEAEERRMLRQQEHQGALHNSYVY